MIRLKDILSELDYPLAGKEDLQSYGGMAGWKGKIVYMSPDKFLRLAAPLPDWAINKESLKKIEDRMKGQLPLDFCVLEVDMKTKTVTGHEGRHRCMAAKKLGIEKVPVLIYTGSSFDRVPQWDQSTHDVVDKADFKPQLKEYGSDVSTKNDRVIVGIIKTDGSDKIVASDSSDVKTHYELHRKYQTSHRDYVSWRYNKQERTLFFWHDTGGKAEYGEKVKEFLVKNGFTVDKITSINSFPDNGLKPGYQKQLALHQAHGGYGYSHPDELKTKRMFESDETTLKMYHGGSRWSYLPDEIQPGKKNRYEAGVGIYFTNSYKTARKYAKGNKVVHLVEIDKQFKDIEDVTIPVGKITEFVKNVPQLSSKSDIINDINAYSTRVGKTEVPLSILNNLVVNYQAARGKSGVYIAKFFTECGADGHIQKQSGDEIWLVVFNPKILKSVKVVNPKEINSASQFMLPVSLMEGRDLDYDVAEDFMRRRDDELMYLCRALKNSGGKGRVTWKTIPATLLKRVWLQFGKYHRINSNDLDKIADQILTNIARLRASTEMMGHSQIGKEDIENETGYEFTDEEWDDWMTDYFTDLNGSWLLSDYGLPKLEEIYPSIFNAKTDEEKLYACDKALNVIHQRNDLASMFVEGGSKTLRDVANQGGYTSEN